jgi:tripartite-type tricarboxylate transporter receptor subunit TctC
MAANAVVTPRMQFQLNRLVHFLVALVLLSGAASAQTENFYKGKTLTIISGFAAGGGVDTSARVIQRHLWRFIPGSPDIIVQSIEGAGGVIAANFLDKRVAPDGLTLGMPGRSWYVEGIVKTPGVNFDPTRFAFIGSSGVVASFLFVRADTGIKNFDDLRKSPKPIPLAAITAGTPTAMVPRLLAQIGIPVEAVLGYGSTARTLVAVESGEAAGLFITEDSVARRPDLIKNHVIIPVLQTRPVQPDIPLLRDVVPPSRQGLLELALALDTFGLMLVGPPGVPADRVAILRKAFSEMCADREYLGDMARVDLVAGEPLSGETLEAEMRSLASKATPETIAQYRELGGRK